MKVDTKKNRAQLYLLVSILFFQNFSEASFKETITEDFKSPLHAKTEFISLLLAGTIVYQARNEFEPIERSWRTYKPLGGSDGLNLAKVGDYSGQGWPNLFYVGFQYFYANPKNASLMFRSYIYSGFWVLLGKNLIKESRPEKQNELSFPSGHSQTAFAFASVIGSLHGKYYGFAAYSLATLVALSRVNDGQHYFHDTVFGAALGIGYGLGLTRKETQKVNWFIHPLEFKNQPMIALTITHE